MSFTLPVARFAEASKVCSNSPGPAISVKAIRSFPTQNLIKKAPVSTQSPEPGKEPKNHADNTPRRGSCRLSLLPVAIVLEEPIVRCDNLSRVAGQSD